MKQLSTENCMQLQDARHPQIFTRHGYALSYCIEGPLQAPVLIFINSLGTDLNMWQAQADFFKSMFRVLRYDSRGHGQSEVQPQAELSAQAEDVLDLMDALNINQAHFCGISMGGQVALQLGLMAPERVNSLSIANSAAKVGTSEAWQQRAEQVMTQGLDHLVHTTHSRWFSSSFDYQQHTVAQKAIQSLATTPAAGYAAACLGLAQADFRGHLGSLDMPVQIICGEYDPVTTPAHGAELQAEISSSQLHCLPASHLSNIEASDAFNQLLFDFISKRNPSSANNTIS